MKTAFFTSWGKLYAFDSNGLRVIAEDNGRIYPYQNEGIINGKTVYDYNGQIIKQYDDEIIKAYTIAGKEVTLDNNNIIKLDGEIISDNSSILSYNSDFILSEMFVINSEGKVIETAGSTNTSKKNPVWLHNRISSIVYPSWWSGGVLEHTNEHIQSSFFDIMFDNDTIETEKYIYSLSGSYIDKDNKKLYGIKFDTSLKQWVKNNGNFFFDMLGIKFVRYARADLLTENTLIIYAYQKGIYEFDIEKQNYVRLISFADTDRISKSYYFENNKVLLIKNNNLVMIDIKTGDETQIIEWCDYPNMLILDVWEV
jgi:hypothetical protein